MTYLCEINTNIQNYIVVNMIDLEHLINSTIRQITIYIQFEFCRLNDLTSYVY